VQRSWKPDGDGRWSGYKRAWVFARSLGTEALVAKPYPGRPARLSARQKQRLPVKVGTAKEISIKELVELIADIILLVSRAR